MDTFGSRLRAEREDRGLSIEAVAEKLHVERERLLALERDDHAALPAGAAMTACLRAYADCLEVDAELMIEDYLAERERCLARLAEALVDRAGAGTAAAERRRAARAVPWRSLAAVTFAAAAVGGAWWLLSGDGPSPAPPRATASAPVEPELPPPAPSAPPQAQRVPLASAAGPSGRPAASPARSGGAATTLGVAEHGVGTGVRDRRLTGQGDRFDEGRRVWFWTRIEGGRAGDPVDHVWLRDGAEVARVRLKVGGPSWRTYSSKTLHAGSAGAGWAVEARDERGRVLARSEFACSP